MSQNPPPKLSTDWLKQTTEATGAFIRWIAELIQRRNWFTLLVLTAVVFSSVSILLREAISSWLPDRYETAIWTGVAAIVFLACFCALILATTTTKRLRGKELPIVTERKAIKGLRPFCFTDSVIFSRLQRHQILRECLDSITSHSYRFGLLVGDSGCGKTSFLQAGLSARLPDVQNPHRGIYVQFSDEPPLQSIRRAFSDQLKLNSKIAYNTDFLEMLEIAEEAANGSPLVLILDQFEQFFVHNTTEVSRQAFIDSLASWYSSSRFSTVKVIVSVRSDLAYQVYTIQKALGCTLGPQDSFILRKFTPSESAQVLSVIAETEHLRCDEKFLEELSSQELASDEDSLISPVDLQILAWMIDRQSTDDLRAFNRTAFQKIGGVDGLLNRFLDRALSSLALPSQRQAAIKVMLALVDLERQVRVGFLTLPQLQRKVRDSVKPDDVAEAVHWLSQSNVRLITSRKQSDESSGSAVDVIGYELAHERVIPALMQIAGKKLTQLDRINQLLERRVNEWIGNQRSPRFLLSLSEVWLVQRQKAYIDLGRKASQKKALIQQSLRRNHQLLATTIAWLIGAVLLFNISSRFLSGGLSFSICVALVIPLLITASKMASDLRSIGSKKFLYRFSTTVFFLFFLLLYWRTIPRFSDAYTQIGLKAHQAGVEISAESNYKRAIALDSSNQYAHYNLAVLYEEQELFDKAIQEYTYALDGPVVGAYNNLARLRISRTGDGYEVATELLKEGLFIAEYKGADVTTQYNLMKNLGWALLQQNRLVEAERALDEAIKLSAQPEASRDLNNKASAHCLMAQVAQVLQDDGFEDIKQWQLCKQLANPEIPEEAEWLELADQLYRPEKLPL